MVEGGGEGSEVSLPDYSVLQHMEQEGLFGGLVCMASLPPQASRDCRQQPAILTFLILIEQSSFFPSPLPP